MGSAVIAAWVAHAAFWILILHGYLIGELTAGRVALFLLLWTGGLLGLPHAPYAPARAMFPSFVAILDIALVFLVFKGDVRIA
jgi:hypothetical protein